MPYENKMNSANHSTTIDTAWRGLPTTPLTLKLKYKAERYDDLGNGNFRWQISIASDELFPVTFTYHIFVEKGNGSTEEIEESSGLMTSGGSYMKAVGAAKILRVTATEAKLNPAD